MQIEPYKVATMSGPGQNPPSYGQQPQRQPQSSMLEDLIVCGSKILCYTPPFCICGTYTFEFVRYRTVRNQIMTFSDSVTGDTVRQSIPGAHNVYNEFF